MELGSNGIQNKGSGGAPAPPPAPSGVLFKTVEPSQYTSYRTGDEGWRVQNGFFDYTPPTNPAAIAELDYTSANFFNVLKNNLVVNGVSSKTRFVDVNGVQVFSAVNNVNLVVIDKLTGLMYTRVSTTPFIWDNFIDSALSYSIVVNGVTLDDWFGPSITEINNVLHNYASVNSRTDTLTSVLLFGNPTGSSYWSATTDALSSLASMFYATANRQTLSSTKVNTSGVIFVRNARNLITAP
jgi:hypothetical protein